MPDNIEHVSDLVRVVSIEADSRGTDSILLARNDATVLASVRVAVEQFRRNYGILPEENIHMDLELATPGPQFVRLRNLLRNNGTRP